MLSNCEVFPIEILQQILFFLARIYFREEGMSGGGRKSCFDTFALKLPEGKYK